MKARSAVPAFVFAAMCLFWPGCRGGSVEGWSDRARTMILTSGPSEIVISASKVPGYWARETAGDQDFFLFTRDRTFEKGARVKVDGPFGGASFSAFREETGVYMKYATTPVLVVWKIARSST
jgi:hypothetical protein